jgi:dehydrogenase/reductase SDR family member 4
MQLGLGGKTAIVTGGSRGIGLATARTLANEGCAVAICGRDEGRLDAAVAALRASGARATGRVADVCDEAAVNGLVDAVTREFGRIDILVNNAATNIAQGPALEMDEGQFDKMVEVNLKSTYRLTRLVAPGMSERGTGSIINIASIAGLRPQYHGLLYSMTKAALIMMTQSYAVELGPKGVRVNAIAPGLVQTVLSEYYWKDESRLQQLMAHQPIRHLGQPPEIAEVALMLASDASSYLTGQTIVVDGGRLLSSM